MLTGMAPTFTVRAREARRCALLERAAGRRVLGTEAGATYVAESMRKRLTYTGHTVHGLLDVGTAPVSAVMSRPVFCGPRSRCAKPPRVWVGEGVSALLIRLEDDRLGILTDAERAAAVAVDGVSLRRPGAPRGALPGSDRAGDQLAIEATVEMLAAGAEHVAVLEGDRVCGLVSATDLLSLETRSRSPCAMCCSALRMRTRCTGRGPHPGAVPGSVPRGRPPRDLGRVLSLQLDTLVARLIDFSICRRTGRRPLPWAGSISAARLGASSRSPPTRTTRSPTGRRPRRPGGRRVLRAARRGRQRRARELRHRRRQQRRARRQPAVAHVEGRLARDVRRVPERTRRVASDPRHRVVRLPPDARAGWRSRPS